MKRRYALMSAVVNVLFFVTLELGLRALGFHYSRFPRLMQPASAKEHIAWQNTNRVLQHFVPDARRMWNPSRALGR
jgi:hypothetical protein